MILEWLFQIILLSWSMIALAQSPIPVAKPDCQSSCGNVSIPYPFGIGSADCYANDWFAIDCNSSKPFLRKINLEVLDIILPLNRLLVNHPVYNSCQKNEIVNLEDSSFYYSEDNRFIGLGCNNVASLHINKSVIGGCLATCEGNQLTRQSCGGFGCCETSIAAFFQIFNATTTTIEHENDVEQECKYAFLADNRYLIGNYPPTLQNIEGMTHVPAVLNWGIHNSLLIDLSWMSHGLNCSYQAQYSCATVFGINRTYTPIVQCTCRLGFDGNPYLLDGCQDIDECAGYHSKNYCQIAKYHNVECPSNSSTTVCPPGMSCLNRIGGYNCISPTVKSKDNKAILIGVGTGLAGLMLIVVSWWLHIITTKRKDMKLKEKYFRKNGGLLLQQQLASSDGSAERIKVFNAEDLDKATDHFNVNRILGRGGQGTVYKGMLEDGRIVAIKKCTIIDESKVGEFINEVFILSQISHRQVVKIYGCCLETEVPSLVYEFIPNGTLSQYLHDQNKEFPFTWDMRLRIAIEVAGALFYLHSANSFPIYHRDIKSTNILLDEKYRAKVADFGTSRSIAIDQTHVTTKVLGTFGYLDPEYFQSSQFTDKSDVYSFGVVLVELLTGKKPITSTKSEEAGRSLVAYFINSMEEKDQYDVLDSQLLKLGNKDQILSSAHLAKRCLNLNGRERPSMREVAVELERIRASQNDSNVVQNYEEAEYVRTEVIEPWDVVSTSSGSTLSDIAPSVETEEPLSIEIQR